jgi:hypothetical protein
MSWKIILTGTTSRPEITLNSSPVENVLKWK